MIQTFETLRLNNKVLIDEKVLGTNEVKAGFITGITKSEVSVAEPGSKKTYFCKSNQIGSIKLDKKKLIEIGFVERNMTDYSAGLSQTPRIIQDLVLNPKDDPRYLITAKEDAKRGFLFTLEESGFVLGTGYTETFHQLQNMISDWSNGSCEI